MRILLVDADSKTGFPNLALMKLSAWHKQQGHEVDLIKGTPTTAPLNGYDKTYVSCIFFQNREKVLDYASQFNNIQIGGSGYDYNIVLDNDIEHIMPDYSLYGVDFSMGFTSRGCIRNCGFCVVPEKEGTIRDHAPITEFLKHDRLLLLDNNFLASPRCIENLQYLAYNRTKVNFNQGLDIRLVDDRNADLLASCRYYDWKFKTRKLCFAFDDLRYEKEVFDGIDILERNGIPPHRLMFYILIGYNTTEDEDLYRANKIVDRGASPYIMPYNKHKSDLTRFYNRMYYQFMPWEVYNK